MQKSRPWAAMVAVVVLAALVVLSGCQGAVGPAGKDGTAGPAGPAGPAGAPGTTDNAPPTPGTIPTQYLVVGGLLRPAATVKPTDAATLGSYGSVEIDLNAFFTDAEAPSLTYKAVSDDKKIASVGTTAITNLVTGSKLKVSAVGVGTVAAAKSATATITVEAYDGVNAPVTASFDVVVVASNSAPSVTGVDPINNLVDTPEVDADAGNNVAASPAVKNKLYKVAGTITRTFKATVDPGSIGTEKETLKFRTIVGTVAATDDVVSVTAPVNVGINTYSVDITALKPSVSELLTDATDVQIFAEDSFGAEAFVTSFKVTVNRPPTELFDLPNVVLYRGGTAGTTTEALKWDIRANNQVQGVMYTLDQYFGDLELDASNADETLAGDTTCTFSTSPKQPTGRMASASGATLVVTADLATAATLATVNNGALVDGTVADLTSLTDVLASNGMDTTSAMVVVNSGAGLAAGEGSLTLTITCHDIDARVSNSAQIVVRSGTG